MKAIRVVVALVLVAALAVGAFFAVGGAVGLGDDDPLLGGEGSKTLAPTPTPQSGSTEPPAPDLAQFYGQQLTWSPCRGDFECAQLTVPVDYQDPAGETIDIAVLKDPADDVDQRVGSLVVNPGGPGAPGTSYAESSTFAFGEPIRARFDIVGFDPRGTGDSAPVDCLSDSDLDRLAAGDPDPETADEERQLVAAYDAFFAGCLESSGPVVGHITTAEAARDVDVLRAALGESALLYFGASYGTKLGATYAELFPDKVGRLVLDGAVDLSIDARQLSLEQAAGFEVALRSYVQSCVDRGDCFLGEGLDAGLARVQGLMDDIDQTPLSTTDGDRELTAGLAFYGLAAPLYNQEFWPILDRALEMALEADGSLLLRLADLYQSRNQDGTYADNSAEAILAINCLDDPYAVTAAEVPAQVPDFEEASPTFGELFAWGLTACADIRVERSEPEPEIDGSGAAPILVVGTTRDPATPYEWAVHLADQLESGVLVSRDGDGHTGYNAGNDCVDAAVEDYLIDGSVPADGLEC